MMQKEHTLLVEKYRSKSLDEYVGNENIKQVVAKYLSQNDIQNLIFYGPPGSGKTTLAKLIVNNLDCDYLYINASDERGIETIRDKVQGFASTASFKPLKVVILDEISGFATENTTGHDQAKTADAIYDMYRGSVVSRFNYIPS